MYDQDRRHIGKWGALLAGAREQQQSMEHYCSLAIDDCISGGGCIHCVPGCSSCCTLAVNCTGPEALAIGKMLNEQQLHALDEYIYRFRHGIESVVDFKSYLSLHRSGLGNCPFLAEGLCSIYSVRPVSCRSLLSTRESFWCGADFSLLDRETKDLFIQSLDRSRVAFPMHYLAATQQAGQFCEDQISIQMMHTFHLSLSGSMPALVYLFARCRLLEAVDEGVDAVMAVVRGSGLENPLILQIETL